MQKKRKYNEHWPSFSSNLFGFYKLAINYKEKSTVVIKRQIYIKFNLKQAKII